MDKSTYLIVFIALTFLLYTNPYVLVNFSNSVIGKLVLLLLIVGATIHSTVAGLLMAGVLIILTELKYSTVQEGLTNSDVKKELLSNISRTSKFKREYCKLDKNSDGTVGLRLTDGKNDNISVSQFIEQFPDIITFKNDQCDPCDQNCNYLVNNNYDIDRLTQEELLQRPASSNLETFDEMRSKDVKGSEEINPIPVGGNEGKTSKKKNKSPEASIEQDIAKSAAKS